MAKAWTCDRCGAVSRAPLDKIEMPGPAIDRDQTTVELCEGCTIALRLWLSKPPALDAGRGAR